MGNLFLPDAARTGVEAASAWEYCLYVYDRDNYGLYDKDLKTGTALTGMSGGMQFTTAGDKIRIEIPLAILGNPGRVGLMAMGSRGERVVDVNKAGATVPDKAQGTVLYGATILIIPQNTTITYYLYNESGQVLCEMNSSGAITTKYYYLNGQMVARKQGTATSYYHNDHLGSPRAITDAGGNVAWQQDYYAFGKDYGTVASGNVYKFNDKPLEETGLYNYGARYYDPEIGRFTSPDALVGDLENPQSINPYVYCCNNPLTKIDPSGEWWFITHWIVTFVSEVITGTYYIVHGIFTANLEEIGFGLGVLALSPITATCSMLPDLFKLTDKYLGTNWGRPGDHGPYWGEEGYYENQSKGKRSLDPMKRGRMYHARQDASIHRITKGLPGWVDFFIEGLAVLNPLVYVAVEYDYRKSGVEENIMAKYDDKQRHENMFVPAIIALGAPHTITFSRKSTIITLFRPRMFANSTMSPSTEDIEAVSVIY